MLMTNSPLAMPLTLPCGATLKNRIIKSPMSDSLGDGRGNPTEAQQRLYQRWADGGTALSLIGEVQVGHYHPEKPGNLVLGAQQNDQALAKLAMCGSAKGAQIWPQLGHAGALTHDAVNTPKGPSALNLDGLNCQALSLDEIRALPDLYASAAKRAQTAGFGGVQIHAGHGFLLSQFLSPLFNHRQDDYGGAIEHRFRIIGEIIAAVRTAVGAQFPIGIRINSSDKLMGGLTEDDALRAIGFLDNTSVDLIDISGGTYFPGAPSSSDRATLTGAYYIEFARRAKALTSIPIMLSGGMREIDHALDVITSGAADAVGLGRAMALDVDLPNKWIEGININPVFPRFDNPVEGGITAWYSMLLTAIGEDKNNDFSLTLEDALRLYDDRDDLRTHIWRDHFSL